MRSISHRTLIITKKHKQTIKVVQHLYGKGKIGSVSNRTEQAKTATDSKTTEDASPFYEQPLKRASILLPI